MGRKKLKQSSLNEALKLADEFNRHTATLEDYVQSSDFELLKGLSSQINSALEQAFDQEADELVEMNCRVCELVSLIEAAGGKRETTA